jgi:hypothetical protein
MFSYNGEDGSKRVCARFAIASGPGERLFVRQASKSGKTYLDAICLVRSDAPNSHFRCQLESAQAIRLCIAFAGACPLRTPVLRKIIRVGAKDTHCEGFCVR